jgi:hypothetical protein
MDAGILVPLGVFAMLVAGWVLQSWTTIADRKALSRERLAALERGLPPPGEPSATGTPPTLPERAGDPLKPTLALLAIGIPLWVWLEPDDRIWGVVLTALGAVGLGHWLLAGREAWRRMQAQDDELHRAYVAYLKGLGSSRADGPTA